MQSIFTTVTTRLSSERTDFFADQIITLCIILDQSLEWNSPLHVNFVDCEKAFHSVDSKCLWKLLRHYGVPEKITSIIQNSCKGLTSSVLHKGQFTDDFLARTSVRQGCLLSPFLFLLAIDRLDYETIHIT